MNTRRRFCWLFKDTKSHIFSALMKCSDKITAALFLPQHTVSVCTVTLLSSMDGCYSWVVLNMVCGRQLPQGQQTVPSSVRSTFVLGPSFSPPLAESAGLQMSTSWLSSRTEIRSTWPDELEMYSSQFIDKDGLLGLVMTWRWLSLYANTHNYIRIWYILKETECYI